jgi:D-alanyl-D-alanine carboxypeptidase
MHRIPGRASRRPLPSAAVALGVTLAMTLAGCANSSASLSGTAPATDEGGLPEDRDLTPFDTGYPAIQKLDPSLLGAVQKAAGDAQARDIRFIVTSGWRSKEYQQRLLDEAVVKYGNLEKARRFVNTPEKSAHVSGTAIDIGPTDADDWLIQHGSDYGLCQIYANEMWHFELRAGAGGDCPALLTDAAE